LQSNTPLSALFQAENIWNKWHRSLLVKCLSCQLNNSDTALRETERTDSIPRKSPLLTNLFVIHHQPSKGRGTVQLMTAHKLLFIQQNGKSAWNNRNKVKLKIGGKLVESRQLGKHIHTDGQTTLQKPSPRSSVISVSLQQLTSHLMIWCHQQLKF